MRNDKRTVRGGFLIAFMFVCAADSRARVGAAEPEDNVVEAFDVARDGDLLLVPVALGDEQLQFVLDTGCACSVVDTEVKLHLEPRPGSARINGRGGPISRYHLREAHVGRSRLPVTGDAVRLDLRQIREASGYDIRGLLGMTFLKSYVVRIDFDTGKLSILKRVPAAAGREFRLFYGKAEVPLLDVEIADGEAVAFMVDTGMVGSALSFRTFRFDGLVHNGRLEPIGATVPTVTGEGEVRVRVGRLDKIRLGDFGHERIRVDEGERNQLGLELLSRYIVTFDFPNDRLYLKAGERFAEPHKIRGSGLVLKRIDGKTRIEEVEAGSTADVTGVKAGEKLLQFDGKDTSSLSLFQIRSILATVGRRVRLDVEGPAGRREVEIRVPDPDESKPTSSK